MKLIKNANVYAPESLGLKDILIVDKKIKLIQNKIDISGIDIETIDAEGKIVTPGFIDRHLHITGAGGHLGYHSMTPGINLSELIACGSTTVVGMLGTDGVGRNLETLYAKAKALDMEGITTYILTGFFGIPSLTFTNSVERDIIFIDKVLGCKIAISDVRSSYPTVNDLLKLLRHIHVGGLTSGKKAILHFHLGALESKMDILFELVEKHGILIQRLSPTHVGRTKPLFEQAIKFAKLGGIIDISTGGTKYAEPYEQVMYALEKGVSVKNMTFSSDGNAGMSKKDEHGNIIGFYKAPVNLNLLNVQKLINEKNLDISDAVSLVTLNPANDLSLKHKGRIENNADADFCFFDKNFNLTDVIALGQIMMKNSEIIKKGAYE